MTRRAHFIGHNSTSSAPSRFIFVDTEALQTRHTPQRSTQRIWFGCAIYVQLDTRWSTKTDKLYFRTPGEFWDWVESHTRKGWAIWLVAHNWNYDACILATDSEMRQRGWLIGQRGGYINGKPPLIVRWQKDGKAIRMIDSLNYFSSSLQALGDATGLAKLEMPDMPIQTENIEPNAKWVEYCWRDVEIVKDAVLMFRDFVLTNDLGTMQNTLASQSMTAFKHRFMTHKILVHQDSLALKLERESYHGGRTEAFYNGVIGETVYKLDINSQYPAIMANGSFSARLVASWAIYHAESFNAAIDAGRGLVARCLVETDQACYGVIDPVKHRLIFPIGRFWTTLSTPEIRYALDCGHILKVTQWAEYEREPLFAQFVEHFYTQRMAYRAAGNQTFDYLCKILLNSLYGKFGQTGRRWEETPDYHVDNPAETWSEDAKGNIIKLRQRLGSTQLLQTDSESENSCPIIAAEITAAARLQLWQFCNQAGEGNVYYCDTDSLVVNEVGYNRLAHHIDPDALGMLKLEDIVETGEIRAPKHYALGDDWKIKGVSQKAILTSEITTRTLQAKQPQFRSWDYNLSKGETGRVTINDIVKTISGENTKRRMCDNGWTQPLEMWDVN